MKMTIKKVNNELLGIDDKNNFFILDGCGVWQSISNKKLFKLLN